MPSANAPAFVQAQLRLIAVHAYRYVDVWRNCLDVVSSNSRIIDGKRMYPHGYSDKGPGIAGGCGNIGTPDWVDFKETPMAIGAAEIYYWSMDPADLERVPAIVTHAGAQHGAL